VLVSQGSAGGAADLHRLESLLPDLAVVVGHSAADVEHDLADGGAEGHFHQAGVGHVPGQREGLGSRRTCRADAAEDLRTLVDDARNVRQRLDVVDDGRLAPQSALRRERRLGRGHAAQSFDGRDHGGLFAAHERARAFHHFAAQRQARTEDILAEDAFALGVGHGLAHARHGERILGAHVDERVAGADGARRDHQAFDDAVRIAFHHGAVHERAGIALVAVADDVLLRRILHSRRVPLAAGRESAAAASAQPGVEDVLQISSGDISTYALRAAL
jgi:hypothetical protein